jgi:hypothetical protein
MNAAFTIQFNCPDFLLKQINSIRKYVKSEFHLYVFDNSDKQSVCEKNKQIAINNGAFYHRLRILEGDPSRHHGLAINAAFEKLSNYKKVLLFDHDIFPYKNDDIFNKYNDFDFAGIAQIKADTTYLAPILFLVNDYQKWSEKINMLPCAALDTGGMMNDVLKTAKVAHINEYLRNIEDVEYSEVDDSWMHFIKGSGWDRNPNHEDRIKKLLGHLKKIQK